MRPGRFFLVALVLLSAPGSLAGRAAVTLKAKNFPPGYFLKYQKISPREKGQILARIAATLKKLNQEGYGLIAKGAVVERLGTDRKIYDRLTILDDSGLLIIARRVPNLYYGYPGPAAPNPNVYLILKNVRVNFPDSYIRGGFVVEGDFQAYAQKFVEAIRETLENAAIREDLGPPAPVRGKGPEGRPALTPPGPPPHTGSPGRGSP